jgi:transposase
MSTHPRSMPTSWPRFNRELSRNRRCASFCNCRKKSPRLRCSHLMGQQQAAAAHQPSSTIPPFQKPSSKLKSNKKGKPGAKIGHKGASRKKPERIDHHVDHMLPCCPHCEGKLLRTGDTRTRITEDMPADLKFETTEHTIHSDWCPRCKKRVEPKLPEVLPQCTLGNRLLAFTGWMHYGNGLTISQISATLNYHLQIKITDGGLVQIWHRLAEILWPWYEQIHAECLGAAVLHADETGWRVNGKTHWLWCFTQSKATFYMIDSSRGHAALEKFFVEEFDGVLITDFWAAYDEYGSDSSHQRCWPHLLRDVKEVSTTNTTYL